MKHMQNRLSARRARGLTLIELMISVAIGLVLMIAITSIKVNPRARRAERRFCICFIF